MTSVAAGAVLFDLDGTLTDPFIGITRSIQSALEAMDKPMPDAESLRRYIGPPLQETFLDLLGDEEAAGEALRLYRARYAEAGKFENILIPGIVAALETVRSQATFMSVATSKLESYSVEIVQHFDLGRFFDAIHGSRLDGSHTNKAELIRFIVETHGLDPARTVMIGDRRHDVVGATANGIRTIGVLWGFGDRAELEMAGAAAIAGRPEDLPGLVASLS